jgi:hypothetical protein
MAELILEHSYTGMRLSVSINLFGSAYQLPPVVLKLHQTYSNMALMGEPDRYIIKDWSVYDRR